MNLWVVSDCCNEYNFWQIEPRLFSTNRMSTSSVDDDMAIVTKIARDAARKDTDALRNNTTAASLSIATHMTAAGDQSAWAANFYHLYETVSFVAHAGRQIEELCDPATARAWLLRQLAAKCAAAPQPLSSWRPPERKPAPTADDARIQGPEHGPRTDSLFDDDDY